MDPVSLLIGAAIALGGVGVGRLLGKRSGSRRAELPAAPPQPPRAICGCGHHLVFHDKETKMCKAQVALAVRWPANREHVYRTCVCQGYRGPTPVDEYYAPDLMSDDPGP